MLWTVWFIGGLILILIGVVCAGGALLPREHVASASVLLHKSPAELFAVVRDAGHVSAWRKAISNSVVHEGPADAPISWTESGKHGDMKMRLERAEPDRVIVARIDDNKLPFGGAWTFEFTPEAGGTRVRITENGFVNPPPFRFLSKFVFGHDTNLREYLTDLAAKMGEPARIEP